MHSTASLRNQFTLPTKSTTKSTQTSRAQLTGLSRLFPLIRRGQQTVSASKGHLVLATQDTRCDQAICQHNQQKHPHSAFKASSLPSTACKPSASVTAAQLLALARGAASLLREGNYKTTSTDYGAARLRLPRFWTGHHPSHLYHRLSQKGSDAC